MGNDFFNWEIFDDTWLDRLDDLSIIKNKSYKHKSSDTTTFSLSSDGRHWTKEFVAKEEGEDERLIMTKHEARKYTDLETMQDRYELICTDKESLSQTNVLRTLMRLKSEFVYNCAPYKMKDVKCKMSPIVKENLIKAYRKLHMYGKKLPIIVSFDEYGRRLPDQLQDDLAKGITVKIVDSEQKNNYFLAFDGEQDLRFTQDDRDVPF